MAFVPHSPLSTTSLLPVAQSLSPRRPTACPCPRSRPRRVAVSERRDNGTHTCSVTMSDDEVRSADAMEFFRHREGRWSSWRVTHHLAFQRAESGESEIEMKVLARDDERVVQLCNDWEVDASLAQGGCHVTWRATMAWDQEGENHEGATVFALVPDKDDVRRGRILRDRGYAEIVPIAGTYYMDDEDALNLETPYEGGAVEETFSFDGPDTVNRSSTVRRFGGLSTATFSTERRLGVSDDDDDEARDDELTDDEAFQLITELSILGPYPTDATDGLAASSTFTGRPRWGAVGSGSTPATSAFGSGFSGTAASGGADAGVPATSAVGKEAGLPSTSAFATGPPPPPGPPGAAVGDGAQTEASGEAGVGEDVQEMAEKAGIDLSKVPPSMRADFLASLKGEAERKG